MNIGREKLVFNKSVIISIFLLASCLPAPSISPNPAKIDQTIEPFSTGIPTQIFEPTRTRTPTPFPPPSETGPHLIYDVSAEGKGPVVIMDPDGTGRKLVDLPDEGINYPTTASISPTGEWIVLDASSLILFNLIDETSLSIGENGFDLVPNREYFSRITWSPRGDKIAFLFKIKSSEYDVYVFDFSSRSLEKLTTAPKDLYRLEWSPDGTRIMAEGGDYGIGTLYLFDPFADDMGQNSELITDGWLGGAGWVSSSKYLFMSYSDGCCCPCDLRLMDINTKKITSLWEHDYLSFAINPLTERIVLSTMADLESFSDAGSFVISFDGEKRKISEDVIEEITYIGGKYVVFAGVTIGRNPNLIQIDAQYNVSPLSFDIPPSSKIAFTPSPDHAYFTVLASGRLYLFNQLAELIFQIEDLNVTGVIWRPDNMGFFFISEGTLYLFSLDTLEYRYIDECSSVFCKFSPNDFAWTN